MPKFKKQEISTWVIQNLLYARSGTSQTPYTSITNQVLDLKEEHKIKAIRNMNDLQAAMKPILKEIVDKMADRVYETLNYFLQDYYDGYEPTSYRRQYDFLRSAVKVEPKVSGNKVIAYVYIDTDYMSNYYNATGYQAAKWANEGMHGGITVDHKPHVWDDTIEETINNGELLKMAMQYLKSKGITVNV